ncbi:MAG: ABC transporter permease subunit [Planctomycetota bacterium]|jgi:phosphate transport system permease protein|nr:ABC transporter permease subunit [Planctomycetota bacterium]
MFFSRRRSRGAPHNRQVKFFDRWTARIITAGGILIIAAVIAIVAAILAEAAPLFFPASATLARETRLPEGGRAQPVAFAVDSGLAGSPLVAGMIFPDGATAFIDGDSSPDFIFGDPIAPPDNSAQRIVRAEKQGDRFSLLWDNGAVSLVEMRLALTAAEFTPNSPSVSPPREFVVIAGDAETPPPAAAPKNSAAQNPPAAPSAPPAAVRASPVIFAMLRADDNGEKTVIRVAADGRISERRSRPPRGLLTAKSAPEISVREFTLPFAAPAITAAALSADGSRLFLGTASGEIINVFFPSAGRDFTCEITPVFREPHPITSLTLLFGDATLAAGGEDGAFSAWQMRRENDAWRLRPLHSWTGASAAPVIALASGERSRSLFALSADGQIRGEFTTTGRQLLTIATQTSPTQFAVNRRGDTLALLTADNRAQFWRVHNPYPESGFAGFFRRLWYENYQRPEWVWQSTGSADSEPKLSLMPLLLGTIKGTVYAMLFALPLALLSALYVSQFAARGWRGVIKPAVEMMAAAPSVVVGFLAALWLAPALESHLFVAPFALILAPLLALIFLELWRRLRHLPLGKRVENGYEFLLVILPLAALALTVIFAAPAIERQFFHGDFHATLLQWLAREFPGNAWRYDQRNALIIAFALGFAVIPTIFSLAEDALSSVPPSLFSASLALGASRWQTAWRVILPSASPGIFAAVMIGLGRAVGETMIVLMATGNTPVMSFSPFDGMRTLAANIAVEMPEAPVGGTLYRVLFLCAALLFAQTFVLNTLAEIVRQNLRRRFGRF